MNKLFLCFACVNIDRCRHVKLIWVSCCVHAFACISWAAHHLDTFVKASGRCQPNNRNEMNNTNWERVHIFANLAGISENWYRAYQHMERHIDRQYGCCCCCWWLIVYSTVNDRPCDHIPQLEIWVSKLVGLPVSSTWHLPVYDVLWFAGKPTIYPNACSQKQLFAKFQFAWLLLDFGWEYLNLKRNERRFGHWFIQPLQACSIITSIAKIMQLCRQAFRFATLEFWTMFIKSEAVPCH